MPSPLPHPRNQWGQGHATSVGPIRVEPTIFVGWWRGKKCSPFGHVGGTALGLELLQAFCYEWRKPEDKANTLRRVKPRVLPEKWNRNKLWMKTDSQPVWGGYSFVCNQEHPNSNNSVLCVTTALWKSNMDRDPSSWRKKATCRKAPREFRGDRATDWEFPADWLDV